MAGKKKKEEEKKEPEEPDIKWEDSNAKALLRKDIIDGIVPLEAKDDQNESTMPLFDIYNSRIEFADYKYEKFSSRLSSLRNTLANEFDRVALDQAAFDNYKKNHPVLTGFSRLGLIEWQGSESQRLLLLDIEAGKHLTMSKVDLYGDKPEYYNEFPLEVFRDKMYQELRTAKYLHTLEVKGKDPRKKGKKGKKGKKK